MESKHRHREQAEPPRRRAHFVDVFFHAIANEHQPTHPGFLRLPRGVLEHPLDLSDAPPAAHRLHVTKQVLRAPEPGTRSEFSHPPKVAELYLEPAEGLRLDEHLALQGTGAVPARLPACGGIHGEDESTRGTGDSGLGRQRRHLRQKRVDFPAARSAGQPCFGLGHGTGRYPSRCSRPSDGRTPGQRYHSWPAILTCHPGSSTFGPCLTRL